MRPEFTEPVEDEVWSVNVARCEESREPRESALLRKSKQLHMARLSYDDDEIDEKEKALRDHLASEYERIQNSKSANPRQSMMLMIRKVLVQNPYDQIGRSMASEAKKVFLRQVLKETSWIHKLQALFKIPKCCKKGKKAKQLLIVIPVILALWGTAQKGFFYLYDIYTDVKVIQELRDIPVMTMPKIPQASIQKFFLENMKERGIPALRKPCELLDTLEEIPNEGIPFYKQIAGGMANVHWNPTKNSTFSISDAFQITKSLSEIYEEATSGVADLRRKPSDIKDILRELRDKAESVKGNLRKAESGLIGTLAGWAGFDVQQFQPSIEKAVRVLDKLDRVLNNDLAQHVLKKADKVYENRDYSSTTFPEQVKTFSEEIIKRLRPEVLTSRGQNFTKEDPFAKHLTGDQLKCRQFIARLFTLTEHQKIKDWVIHSYTSNKSENNADGVANDLNSKNKFLTENIIRSVTMFLILNMAWALLAELKSTSIDFWKSRHIPLFTNFKMTCDENDPKSPLLTKGENTSNTYVVKSSKRHSLNIQEVTHETVSAINVQIALWVYMSTVIEDVRRIFKVSFDLDVTNDMFNLSDNSFTDFNSSAMMTSLVAGIFSLTFAQYKQYMTRHEKDAEFSGKIVYFLACAFNSFAIFLSQIVYFAVGLPAFICVLIYVIRLIVNFDQYDTMPNSVKEIIVILVIAVVILPLKFIPIKVAEVMKFLTERFFLHKTYHINERNRSGYDVPGFDTALYMFLPSSHNDLSHVDNKESFQNPGFFYFSKDPLSKKLYRLRFEIQLFCKVLMHTFYLAFSFFFINILHILLMSSTVVQSDYWLSKLRYQDMWQAIIGKEKPDRKCKISPCSECPDSDASHPGGLLCPPLRLLQVVPSLAEGRSFSWF